MSAPSASVNRIVRVTLQIAGVLFALLTIASWLLPVEVAQNWAMNRAQKDEFSQLEAHGAATAAVWLVRWLVTTLVWVIAVVWIRRRRTVPALAQMTMGFWQATAPDRGGMVRTTILRGFILGWFALAIYHAGAGVTRRLWDWPLYQLHSGREILPNISETNREVIRYLAAATPPNAKILVLSDQKLYFLSYYLLPRRLYHPTHPDSEFVIAQPYNQRQLAAYRLQDLKPADIERYHPDFVLEYFEGAEYIDGVDLNHDSAWLSFERKRHGSTWRPTSLVRLRRYTERGTP